MPALTTSWRASSVSSMGTSTWPGTPVGVAVDDQLVDVVVAEPAQAGVDRLAHVLAGQAALVGARAHGHGDLGGQHVLVPGQQLAEELADDLLGRAEPVDVGAVEVEQAPLDGGGEDGPGVVDADGPVALVAPAGLAEVHGAEAQLRHPQAAPAQLDGLEHPAPLSRSLDPCRFPGPCRRSGPILPHPPGHVGEGRNPGSGRPTIRGWRIGCEERAGSFDVVRCRHDRHRRHLPRRPL